MKKEKPAIADKLIWKEKNEIIIRDESGNEIFLEELQRTIKTKEQKLL